MAAKKSTAKKISGKKGSSGSKNREDSLHKIPLRITDTTLRDAHQSLWATRMRTQDVLDIIDVIDNVGYYSLEVWGGATFDVCLRFLRENPWERLRQIKARTKTPLQMLLRGQNLVGYKNYADDVVDKFVELAHANGIDIFRVFDALNDTRNLEAAVKAVKRHGGHAQGTLAYTVSPVHTVEKYVKDAKNQVDLGVDSICIKDMAGILSPIAAEKLVSALVNNVDVPIQLHCHATSGMAYATYVEGVRAGAGAIDCAISSMGGFTAQPPVETFQAIFSETNYSADLDFDALLRISKYFEQLAPQRRLKSAPTSVIDPGILKHQIPGGMISNFRSQLDQQGALDKLDEALEEVVRVRKDLGYPPLVTPTSQIVGSQAVMNVLMGERYKNITNETANYIKGLYGRPPAEVNKDLKKRVLGKEKPIDHRPADDIKPMLTTATEGLEDSLIKDNEDILSYLIFPKPALEYFRWREKPVDQRDPIPADLEIEEVYKEKGMEEEKKRTEYVSSKKPSAGSGDQPEQMMNIEDYRGLGYVISKTAGLKVDELSVKKGDFKMVLRAGGGSPVSLDSEDMDEDIGEMDKKKREDSSGSDKEAEPKPESKSTGKADVEAGGMKEYKHTLDAPLAGTFYESDKESASPMAKPGDVVEEGTVICVVEAMKMFNEIKAPAKSKIEAVLAENGEKVSKGQPLIAYEPV